MKRKIYGYIKEIKSNNNINSLLFIFDPASWGNKWLITYNFVSDEKLWLEQKLSNNTPLHLASNLFILISKAINKIESRYPMLNRIISDGKIKFIIYLNKVKLEREVFLQLARMIEENNLSNIITIRKKGITY